MFSSLNDEIRKQPAVESFIARLLFHAGVLAAAVIGFSALYLGILYLE